MKRVKQVLDEKRYRSTVNTFFLPIYLGIHEVWKNVNQNKNFYDFEKPQEVHNTSSMTIVNQLKKGKSALSISMMTKIGK